MKKLIYLYTVLFILSACSTSKEVYDDVYFKVDKTPKTYENDDLGYADYVKNSESKYEVEIDSSNYRRTQPQDSYYTNTGDINVYNYEGWGGTSTNYMYSNNGWNSGFNSYYSFGYGSYNGCRYHNHHHNYHHNYHTNFYGGCYGGGFYPSYGYGNFYNYGYYNPYGFYGHYGNIDPWFYGGFYGNPYVGTGYYNKPPYYNNDGGGGSGSGGSKPYYGHRGMVNSTNSSNTTAYQETVNSVVGGNKPFADGNDAGLAFANSPFTSKIPSEKVDMNKKDQSLYVKGTNSNGGLGQEKVNQVVSSKGDKNVSADGNRAVNGYNNQINNGLFVGDGNGKESAVQRNETQTNNYVTKPATNKFTTTQQVNGGAQPAYTSSKAVGYERKYQTSPSSPYTNNSTNAPNTTNSSQRSYTNPNANSNNSGVRNTPVNTPNNSYNNNTSRSTNTPSRSTGTTVSRSSSGTGSSGNAGSSSRRR